jgi:hypothetical protein
MFPKSFVKNIQKKKGNDDYIVQTTEYFFPLGAEELFDKSNDSLHIMKEKTESSVDTLSEDSSKRGALLAMMGGEHDMDYLLSHSSGLSSTNQPSTYAFKETMMSTNRRIGKNYLKSGKESIIILAQLKDIFLQEKRLGYIIKVEKPKYPVRVVSKESVDNEKDKRKSISERLKRTPTLKKLFTENADFQFKYVEQVNKYLPVVIKNKAKSPSNYLSLKIEFIVYF